MAQYCPNCTIFLVVQEAIPNGLVLKTETVFPKKKNQQNLLCLDLKAVTTAMRAELLRNWN